MKRFALLVHLLIAASFATSCDKLCKMPRITEGKPMPDTVETLIVGSLGVNCLVIDCGNGEAIVVDPGAEPGRVLDAARRRKLNITHIINTHGHFDHVGANKALVEATGAKLLIHAADEAQLVRATEVSTLYGLMAENSPMPDQHLEDGMTLNVGTSTISVIHTPGHTPGGCSLYFADHNLVVTGDTLFADSIGRTDLPGGSHEELVSSIKSRLFILPDETLVIPGHGPSTTIGKEKRENEWLR